jgi:hypothetical protein
MQPTMVLYRARDDRYEVIDYGMRAPRGLRPEDYPLTGDGAAFEIFPRPRVKDDRSLHGPGSIAVPGVVLCEGGTNCGATEIGTTQAPQPKSVEPENPFHMR